jgi:ATP-dependent exoDNAse (exonuclease V) alpha subunit
LDIENVKTRLHDPNFNHIKYVTIGVIVMLTKNINISKGVVNGTIAMITSIGFDNNKMVTSITIKKFSTNMFLTLKIQTFQYKYTYEAYYYKASFSIILAYAIISHKAQGAPIKSKVFIDIRILFVAFLFMLCYQELLIIQI